MCELPKLVDSIYFTTLQPIITYKKFYIEFVYNNYFENLTGGGSEA